MKRTSPFLVTALVFVLIGTGCYTVLKHPEAGEENYTAHDYRQDCINCHPDYHEYPYGYFYGYYPDYWWQTPRWGYYYAYPWWWDYYWKSPPERYYEGDSDDNLYPRSSSGEKAVRRDILRPPYTSGTTPITVDNAPPPAGSSSGQAGSKQKSESSDGEEKSRQEQKTENKKAPRRDTGRK